MRRRCPACGRQRKKSHEKRCGTDKAYDPDCVTLEKYKVRHHVSQSIDNAIDSLPIFGGKSNGSI